MEDPEDSTITRPFHQLHCILINLAIGGTSPENPSGIDFSARYEIDDVRVFQQGGKSRQLH